MDLKSSPMVDPVLTSRQPEIIGPMKNSTMQQLNLGERSSFFSAPDDNVIREQVIDTHLPDGTEVDVKPLMQMVEELLRGIIINAEPNLLVTQTDVVQLEAKFHHIDLVLASNMLSHTIDKLACEMLFKLLTGTDGHTIALSLFHHVENFHWDAKLALILATFSLAYSPDELENSMDILEQAPIITGHSTPLKPIFNSLSKLIDSVLKLTHCTIQFKELQSISSEVPFIRALNTIPIAIYWNVRGIIACATRISCMGYEYGTLSAEIQPQELSSLVLKINNLLEFLTNQLEEYNRVVVKKKETYLTESFSQVLDMIHVDNMKILKILLNPWDAPLPLFDGTTKQRTNLEVLRKKNVLLLVSGLDISLDDVSILEQIYTDTRVQGLRMESLYEVVWVPIVDSNVMNTNVVKVFEDMMNIMPWYSVYNPSNIDKVVKKSIRDRWGFRNKPVIVVLDPEGRELNLNAFHMMWIWGPFAFPFTIIREKTMWRGEVWRLEFLVSGMDPIILEWARENKYIFLYGGDDIEWIRQFTNSARAMAKAVDIPLEMAYVGKSKKREIVRKVMATINEEKLSYCWQDLRFVLFFWTRIESMLFSKIQLKQADDQDPITRHIKKLLSYDKDGSWAMLCKGSQLLTNGHGSTMLQSLVDFNLWNEHIPKVGFELAFKEYHDKLHGAGNNCCRFEFPVAAGRIPDTMRCPECHRGMEKHTAFLCCHDQVGNLDTY
ncbi:hypothetical protein QVD17_06752 [Tagetes erecta]|uniref:Sieve element occlusion n=1 Tax=Tagetes erecta TaxID=13708 RepID=A0AAD8LK01_TARER|nr:hypothetical protein QVD17_06752 [Tagetes erecta]